MHGGQHHTMVHGHQRQHAFKCSCRTQQVSVHRLGGTHGNGVGPLAKHQLDRSSFHRVVGQCAGAVRIDGINRAGLKRCRLQCRAHGMHLALHAGAGNVPDICGQPATQHLTVNLGTARYRAVPGLKHQHRRAFAQHHATAVLREWLARRGWVICIHGRQRV